MFIRSEQKNEEKHFEDKAKCKPSVNSKPSSKLVSIKCYLPKSLVRLLTKFASV